MKKFSLVTLLALGTTLYAGPLVKNLVIVDLDSGYCDGYHLVINYAKGTVTGNQTGCFSSPLFGTVGGNTKSGLSVSVAMQYGNDETPNCKVFNFDDYPKKWTLSNCDGTLVNSGSYTVGVPGMEEALSKPASADVK